MTTSQTDPQLDQAKRPRTRLAGPYGHPFHPVLVTVPIGAWVASLVFDLAALAADEEATFAEGAYWLIVLGVVGAVVAAVFGLMDLLAIPRGTRAFRTGLTHMALNLTVVVLYVVNLAVRRASGYEEVDTAGVVLSVIALVVLGASGWLGGKLSYTYGVRVAAERTQRDGYV